MTLKNLREKVSFFLPQKFLLLTIFDSLKKQNRKNYVPRLRTKDELLREVKYQTSWKGSGSAGGGYFMEPPIMKPKILDSWTASRVQQPERAYTKFFFSKFKFSQFKIREKPFQFSKNSPKMSKNSNPHSIFFRYYSETKAIQLHR